MEGNYFEILIGENNWGKENSKTLAVKGIMMLTLLETFFCNLIEEIISGITSNCFFPPRINEVSREKVAASAKRKIRQNDEDYRYEAAHIVNIHNFLNCVWVIQRGIVEKWLKRKLCLSNLQGNLTNNINNLIIYLD